MSAAPLSFSDFDRGARPSSTAVLVFSREGRRSGQRSRVLVTVAASGCFDAAVKRLCREHRTSCNPVQLVGVVYAPNEHEAWRVALGETAARSTPGCVVWTRSPLAESFLNLNPSP